MGILPGAANSQATVLDPSDTVPVDDAVATDVQCVLPHHVGGCSCRDPTPEIDNRLQEVGGNPAPATKTRTHTLLLNPRLALKKRIQARKRELYKRTHLGHDYQDRESDFTPNLTRPVS